MLVCERTLSKPSKNGGQVTLISSIPGWLRAAKYVTQSKLGAFSTRPRRSRR